MFTYEQIQNLNKLEIELYNYIISNKKDVVNMSIRELANEVHVSTTAILRFCKKLGCSGYSEFKVRYKMYNAEELNNLDELNIRHVLDFFKNSNSTERKEKYTKAASLISDSKRIIFLGKGTSGTLAKYAARNLINFGIVCQHLDDPYFIFSPKFLEETVVIVLSVSGESPEIIKNIEYFKSEKVTIISITNSLTNTVACMSDVVISYDLPMERRLMKDMDINLTTQIPVVYIIETIGRRVKKLMLDNE